GDVCGAACSDFTVTLEIGVGGNPVTLYVLYGESSARSAAVGDWVQPPFANTAVASTCSGMPAARRLWITAEISGRSSSSFASRSTSDAATMVWYGLKPAAFGAASPIWSAF